MVVATGRRDPDYADGFGDKEVIRMVFGFTVLAILQLVTLCLLGYLLIEKKRRKVNRSENLTQILEDLDQSGVSILRLEKSAILYRSVR